ncbi:MAG: DUF4135 domain-containing protein [Candidatus Korobacteraceae bacterium]|jgi:uncharacterized protein DUF4135
MPREDVSGKCGILLLGWQGTLRPVGEEASAAQDERAFNAFRPWLDAALSRLQDEAPQEHRKWGGKRLPVEQLLAPLLHRLMGIAAAACWRESERDGSGLNVRPADALNATRYIDYAEMVTQQWAGATGLFLQRLHTDLARISAWAGKSDMPGITGLAATNSDLHDAGGSTVRIEFSDGSCVFYKPRPVTGELFWFELTRATALVDPDCEVTAARVLQGGNEPTYEYGWMDELRPDKTCGKLTPLAYWRSAGSLLCHAWVAHMTDLHMGNVLATSTGPAVVDAECLATPEKVGEAENDAVARLSIELARTGLLPAGASATDRGLPDISGYFGNAEIVANIRLPVWIFHENGSASLTFNPCSLIDQGNRRGEDSSISCVPAVVDGFMKAARALVEVRDHLLGGGGWLDRLGSLHAPRILLRDTLHYIVWLNEILLWDGKTTEHRSVKDLAGSYTDRPYRIAANYISSVYEQERLAVERLHVPRFFIPGGSRDLSANLGSILARSVIDAPFAESVRARLEGLSLNSLQLNLAPALLWPMLRNAGSAALAPTG